MARSDPTQPPRDDSKHAIVLRGSGGVAAAAVLAVLAFLLVHQGGLANAVADRRIAAFTAKKESNYQQEINCLTQAVLLAPADPNQRVDLGQVYLDARKYHIRRYQDRMSYVAAAQLVGAPWGGCWQGLGSAVAWSSVTEPGPALQRELFDQFVKPGLAQMIAARDLCPLLPKAQARLAAYAIGGQPDGGIAMAQSDPPSAYWARALALAPYDADLLYYAGQLAFQNGRFDDAWGYWKKSLERRPTHVRAIVEAAAPKLRADGLLERVMPDDTRCLLEAARILAADPSQTSEQRKILDKIKSLLTSDLTVNADSTYQLAVTYRMLGETDNALSQFRTLLVLAPDRGEWRYEYAELLYSLQTNASKQEALQQLNMALLTNPSHIAAQNLRGTITRELKR